MKINSIYWSPTGSTKKVVRLIAAEWEGEHFDLDLSAPDCDCGIYSFAEDELCIIGVPSFGGRVPAPALTRLTAMKADNTPTVIVTAFGNRDYDDTLLEMRNALGANGFHVIAAVAAVTEHSIMHQFGTGRPDADDEKELRAFARKIKDTPERGAALPEISVKGNVPYRDYNGVPMKPKADRTCTKCGSCAKLCPVRAIPVENPSETDTKLCISCMRCIAICPQHARRLNTAMLFVASKALEKSCSSPKANELMI